MNLKDYQNKKILVLGGSGFIGTNLCLELNKLGAIITSTYFTKPSASLPKEINQKFCDLINFDKIDQTIFDNIDIVFICSAVSSGAKIMQNTPLVHFNPNVLINLNAFEISRIKNIKKIIFISSNTVYPDVDYPVNEDHVNYQLFEKYFVVGWMKIFSEKIAEIYSTKINSEIQTIIIRPGNLFGEFDKFDWDKSKVIAATIRKFAEKLDPIVVWGDGNDVKDFMYIKDFIEILLHVSLIEKKFDVINVASGNSVTIKDIISSLKTISNYSPQIEFDLSKPTMIPKRLIDISKLNKIIDVSFADIHKGLNNTYHWYLDNQNDYK